MSVFVVVPHPEQVPRSRVAVASCPVWATLSLITVASKLSVVRAPGCLTTCGAISLFDALIILYNIRFVYGIVLESLRQYTGGMVEVNVQRLRELRQKRVLTLRELEKRSGVAYNTIWHLENGKRGAQPRTIRKLAEALEVSPEELVRVGGSDA